MFQPYLCQGLGNDRASVSRVLHEDLISGGLQVAHSHLIMERRVTTNSVGTRAFGPDFGGQERVPCH